MNSLETSTITFPFIPCQNEDHKSFGPQTAISYIVFRNSADKNFILCCNSCLKKLQKCSPSIRVFGIEEYIELGMSETSQTQMGETSHDKFLEKLDKLKKTIDAYKLSEENTTKNIDNYILFLTTSIAKILFFARKNFYESRKLIFDGFFESYNFLKSQFEATKLHDSIENSRNLTSKSFLNKLEGLTSSEQYYEFIREIQESRENSIKSSETHEKMIELGKLCETLETQINIMDISNGVYSMGQKVVENLKSMCQKLAKAILFTRMKLLDSYLDPMIEELLRQENDRAKNIANNFINGKITIKKILNFVDTGEMK